MMRFLSENFLLVTGGLRGCWSHTKVSEQESETGILQASILGRKKPLLGQKKKKIVDWFNKYSNIVLPLWWHVTRDVLFKMARNERNGFLVLLKAYYWSGHGRNKIEKLFFFFFYYFFCITHTEDLPVCHHHRRC